MHIAALLSGGVDSAVALALYIRDNPEQKKNICAYYLKIWLEDELSFLGSCPWEEDISYVEKTANMLDIPFRIVSLQREYYEIIVAYTLDELKRGRTPSPDIFCNERIKFGSFLNNVDASHIVSGHYADIRRVHDDTSPVLYEAADIVKDQTYFLSHLHNKQIEMLNFPLAGMQKHEVRTFAQVQDIPPYKRKDSQGICFLGKIRYRDFVKHYLGEKKGALMHASTGKILGEHEGAWFYTVGQRRGLGLGNGPWYVAGKNIFENLVFIRHESEVQQTDTVYVDDCHAIEGSAEHFSSAKNLFVKLRHGPQKTSASFEYDVLQNRGCVTLQQGDTGVAAGQYVVFYNETQCLGCARISDAHLS